MPVLPHSPTTGYHFYRLHGVQLRINVEVPTWPTADRQAIGATNGVTGKRWDISMSLADTAFARQFPPDLDGVRWSWSDAATSSLLDVSGGWEPDGSDAARVHFAIDWAARVISVRHSAYDLDNCLHLLNRWVLPDIARKELRALPIHATALAFADRAIVVAGDSGRGKSTLTMAALNQGGRLICDEPTCLITSPAGVHVQPGQSYLRLHPITLERLGTAGLTVDAWPDAMGKTVLVQPQPSAEPLHTAAIIVLDDRHIGPPVADVRVLDNAAAIGQLMGLRYARALKPDRVRTDFSSVCDVVTRVPVFGVSLTDDWHHVNDAVKEVLQRTVGSATDSS